MEQKSGSSKTKWWNGFEAAHKVLIAMVAAVGLGMTVAAWAVGNRTEQNAEAIEVNQEAIAETRGRLDTLEAGFSGIIMDVGLIKCWARHEINGTDPAECLTNDRGDELD